MKTTLNQLITYTSAKYDSIKHLPIEEDEERIPSASPVPLSFEPLSATR